MSPSSHSAHNTRARWPRRVLLLLIAVVGLLGGVYAMRAVSGEHEPFSKVSAWYTGAPPSAVWRSVAPEHRLEVNEATRADAIALLHDREFIALSQDGFALLAPQAPPVPQGYSPYLVRGLQVSRYLHEPHAHVSPTGDIWLKVEAVSRWPLPMLERPLIVLLAAPPKDVYVDAVVHQTGAEPPTPAT